jgi:hypothetical protein
MDADKYPDTHLIPSTMRRVDKDTFFKALMAEKRNIHPQACGTHSIFRDQKDMSVWGWSSYGHRNQCPVTEEIYHLA